MLNLVKILSAKEKMNAAEETQIRVERELAFAIVGLNRYIFLFQRFISLLGSARFAGLPRRWRVFCFAKHACV